MPAQPYLVSLSITHSGKGIPYGPADREDGGRNHGFKNLKGQLHLLCDIPELQEDPALHALVAAINDSRTGLLSIGCLSAPVHDANGHRVTGYIEFAINSADKIADAASYFPVFFHFDRMLHETRFAHQVHFNWELEGASFREVGADGFTATIFINTGYASTAELAREAWDAALDALTSYLGEIPTFTGIPLY